MLVKLATCAALSAYERALLALHVRLLYRVSRLEVVKFIMRWLRDQNEEELEIGSTIFMSEEHNRDTFAVGVPLPFILMFNKIFFDDMI